MFDINTIINDAIKSAVSIQISVLEDRIDVLETTIEALQARVISQQLKIDELTNAQDQRDNDLTNLIATKVDSLITDRINAAIEEHCDQNNHEEIDTDEFVTTDELRDAVADVLSDVRITLI